MKHTEERHILSAEIKNDSEYYNHLMHLGTYSFASKFIANKKVLDYGCGTGYGAHLFSKSASEVVAVDISEEAVEFAKTAYINKNLTYKLISELEAESFDVITSFQVIEHVPSDIDYLKKIKSLLKPGGIFIVSTPDIKNRLFPYIQKPWNIYHLKEYSNIRFRKLLIPFFNEVEMLKIGSNTDFALHEIKRTLKQRNISLLSTLFFYPYPVRAFLLNFIASLFLVLKRLKPKQNQKEQKTTTTENYISTYTLDDIVVEANPALSTELLAICRH